MEYSVQRIEQALKEAKIISFDNSWYKNLYQAKISEGSVLVFWGRDNEVVYSLSNFLNNFHNAGWLCTKIEGEETMEKKTPHKHAELIKKWADGAIIQLKQINGEWADTTHNDPSWGNEFEYRIKPNLVKKWKWVYENPEGNMIVTCLHYSSPEEFNNLNPYNKGKILQKIDSTMIEVEG